ncbi:MAG: DUF354 domain-containing protein [Candidatus Cloacimonetes bacterium]|nr:DUF354 domain-containing protein [Candidatus Cloacimonadota bacterium]
MNILIDINHPAQVHYFRNLYHILKDRHNLVVTTKDVELQTRLLKAHDIPYISFGKKSDSLMGKFFRQTGYSLRSLKIMKEHDIDVAFGSSVSNVHAAKFCKAISIATTDSDLSVLPLSAKFVYPLANFLMTPDALAFQKVKNQICYPGFQELAYLHPQRFTPDQSVLAENDLSEHEPFFVLRFTAFKAHHDVGMYGLSLDQKQKLVLLLEKHGRVIITTETKHTQFEKYAAKSSPEKIHSLLYYAKMLICDSQTMTTEAAVLGTPAFRCNTFAGKLSVIEEIEKKYDLAYSYHPRHFDWMYERIKILLADPDLKEKWNLKRQRMLRQKIDVTAFWAWLLDNHPRSEMQVIKGECDFEQFKQKTWVE